MTKKRNASCQPEGESKSERDADHDYNEFVRLMDKADGYVRSAYADIGILASLASIVASPLIAKKLSPDIDFLWGFMVLLTIVGGLSVVGVLKESLLCFCVCEAARFEAALRSNPTAPVCLGYNVGNFVGWLRQTGHGILLILFHGTLSFGVVAVPTAILCMNNHPQAALYAVAATIVMFSLVAWRIRVYYTTYKKLKCYL